MIYLVLMLASSVMSVTLISNCTELQAIQNNLSETYQLNGDIDCTETLEWNTGQGFTPIGSEISPFAGILDGQGYNIINLFINRPYESYISLFGHTHQNAVITSLALIDVDIIGADRVASLVGYNTGSIENVSASGTLLCHNNNANIGGLVALNFGPITNAYTACSVSSMDYLVGIGGLVGYNYNSPITNAYATGSVSSIGDLSFVGGLVGWNREASITNAYATGSISSTGDTIFVGGLVGLNEQSSITNAYATNSVSSTSDNAYIGGLVGINDLGSIINAYATGFVSSTGDIANVGGLIGWSEGSVRNAYAKGSVYSAGDNANVGGLVGEHRGSMLNVSATGSVSSYGNNVHVGGLVGNSHGPIINGYATGSVSGNGDSTFIGGFAGRSNDTISDAIARGPVLGDGKPSQVGGLIGFNDLNGTINRVNATGNILGSYSAGGLVGQNDGTINDAVSSGQISGSTDSIYIGGLAGVNNRKITSSTATGRVTGNNNVGGLVGLNAGTLTHVKSTGNVFGNNFVGGLTGENYGNISSAYATGLATGTNSVGGLVGMNSGGTIQNVYAAGGATGENNIAGLIGLITNSSTIIYAVTSGCVQGTKFTSGLIGQWIIPPNMASIYWDSSMMEHSQLPDEMAYLDAPPYKRTTEELYQQSTYENWDFTSTWSINEKQSYPYLSALPPETIHVSPDNPCYTTTDLFGFLLKNLFTPLIIGLAFLLVMGFFIRQLINHSTFRSGNLDVCKALPALARLGQLSTIKCICDDASYSPSDNDVRLALRLAALSGHIAIVRYLLTKYQTLLDEKIRTAVAEAAYLRNYPEIANLLVDNYSQTQGTLSLTDLQNQLSQILKKNWYPWFSMLRFGMQGININILYATDVTPLMLSVKQKQFNTALYMVYSCGADVMMTNSNGETVIDQLIQQGKTLQARQLLEIDSNTSEHWRLAFSVICQLISEGKITNTNLSKWLLDNVDKNPRTSTTQSLSYLTHIQIWIALSFCLDMLNRLSDLYLIHTLRDQEKHELANTSLIFFFIAYALDVCGFRTVLGYWFIPLDTNGLWQIVMLPMANPGLMRLTWGVDLMSLHLAVLKLAHFCAEDIAQWVIIIAFYIQAQTFPSIVWMKVMISLLATILWAIWFVRFRSAFQQQRINQGQRSSRSINHEHEERNSTTMRLLADADNK